MSSGGLHLRALPASAVLEKMCKLSASLPEGEIQTLSIETGLAPIRLSATNIPYGQAGVHGDVKAFAALIGARPHVGCKSAVISNGPGNVKIDYASENGVTATIQINANTPDRALRLLESVEVAFTVVPYLDLVGGTNQVEAQKTAMQLRERSVADLREETGKLAAHLADMARADAETRRKLQEQLELDYRKKSDDLAAEHRARIDEVESRRVANDEDLAKKNHDLQSKIDSFNTKESKLVRRQLQEQLNKVLLELENLELSESTRNKRTPVQNSVFGILGGSAVLAIVMGYKVFTGNQFQWHFFGPMTAGTVTFFSTLIYYLKWSDRWFREHAEGELSSKRYKADMIRASWVAELASEWTDKVGGGAPPKELLDAYTENLFRSIGPVRENEHPLEFVSALVKTAQEIDIGKGRLRIKTRDRES